MALNVKAGRFTRRDGTGTTEVDTGLGVDLALVLFFGTRLTADGGGAHEVGFLGAMASATLRATWAWGADDNLATSQTGRGGSVSQCLRVLTNGAPSNESIADFSSFGTGANAGKFTVNWTTNPAGASAIIIHYVAFGGAEVENVWIGSKVGPAAGVTGNKAETGIGFQGNLALFFGPGINTALTNGSHSASFFGAAQSSTARGSIAWNARDGQTMTNHTKRYTASTKCIGMISGTNVVDNEADFVTFDSDGYTLNWTRVTTGLSIYLVVIIKGTFQVAVSNFDSTITGTPPVSQAFTISPAFTPKLCMFFGGGSTTELSLLSESLAAFGAVTASAETEASSSCADDTATTDTNQRCATDVINIPLVAGGAEDGAADFSIFNADGATISWSNLMAVAGKFFVVSMGDAAVGGGLSIPVAMHDYHRRRA